MTKMLESPNKQMKLLNNFPEDLVVRFSSFLPIQSLLKNCLVSKSFRHTEIRSLDLDFTRIFDVCQLEAVNIIQNVFNKHEGSEINRFVLCLKNIGVEESITSWINTCIRKNVQELVLDFSKSRNVMEIPIDFTAIKTLTLLHLRWCKFDIPNNSPKGLRLLRRLSLMQTDVTKEMIEAIFRNCIHLESLELIKCLMYGLLSIPAYNHKKFKSLFVSSMPNLSDIVSYAPNLEYFKYDGYVMNVFYLRTEALKEADLHYKRNQRNYDSSGMVVSNMKNYTEVSVLTTTNIFLEAFTDKHIGDGRMEKSCPFKFENLTEFKILLKLQHFALFTTLLNSSDIALVSNGLRSMYASLPPNKPGYFFFSPMGYVHLLIKTFVCDAQINNFTFECNMFWKIHYKHQIENNNYLMKFLKKVKILGYKGHSHELDIVQFFVKNAPSLEKFKLKGPSNPRIKLYETDYARISYIKSISPRKDLIRFTEG